MLKKIAVLLNYPQSIWRRLLICARTPQFAYITIFVLQIKRIWGIWFYKDLTYGDTSSYYMSAYGWMNELSVKIHWSPLYTAYYGTLLKIFPSIYWATLLHRLFILFTLSIMILALMRRLLPEEIAWLISAWWVFLPINFNALYEVHLFAMVLPLAASLAVLYKPGMWSRGIALGILIVSMVLVRNETVIAVCLWVLICLSWEVRQIKLSGKIELRNLLFAYGLPILFAAFLIVFFNWRTLIKPTPESIARKHTLNVCQIYSFGYQQRYSDWTKSPWAECQDLMLRDFGKPEPTLLEAFRTNPQAILEHFLWNLRLAPAGIQVALFNATSDHFNPDYVPVLLDRKIVLVFSLLSIMLLIVASIYLYKQRRYWWDTWLKNRIWGWLILFCLSCVMLIVIPMQRPRPSYMFLFTLFLMALIGLSMWIVAENFSVNRYYFHRSYLLFVFALILFVPPYYTPKGRPLLDTYNRVAPYSNFLGIPGTGIVSIEFGQELCNYFTKSSTGGCIGFSYEIFRNIKSNESVGEFLDRQPVPVVAIIIENNFIESFGKKSAIQTFLTQPEKEGWKLVSLQDYPANKWLIYVNAKRFKLSLP